MPLFEKDESGVSPYTVSDRMEATKPTPVVNPTALEVADAALRKSNYVTRLFNEKRNPYRDTTLDKTFDPFNADNLKGYEDHADWFAEAKTKKESDWLKTRIDEKRHQEDILRRAGGWGTFADFAASAITPDIAVGVGGVGAQAFKGAKLASKMGSVAVDGALAGAASGALYSAGQAYGDPTKGGTDFAKDVALFSLTGALLTPAFYATGQLVRKVAGRPHTGPTADDITQTTQALRTVVDTTPPGTSTAQQAERLTTEIQAAQAGSSAQAAQPGSSAQAASIGIPHRPPTVQAPYVPPSHLGDMDLVGAFGVQKLSFGQAAVHLANSKFTEAKIAAQQLFRDMRWRKGNLDGTYTTMPSAETEFERLGRSTHGQAMEYKNQLYREYLDTGWKAPAALQHTRTTYGRDKMTRAQFEDEIGIAMSNADRSAVREVTQVAQHGRTLIDQLAAEASRLGLMDTSGNLKGTALSYFGRSYNREQIIAEQQLFKQTLEREFARTNPHFTPAEIRQAAQNTYEHIINGSHSQLTNIKTIVQDTNGHFIPVAQRTRAAPAMERILEISDNVLEPWLDKSYSNFMMRYTNSVGKQIALTKMIGDATGDRLLERLAAEKQMMADAITAEPITDAEKAIKYIELDQDYNTTVRHLKNGVALLNDTYKVPGNPHMAAATAANNIMKFNYLTKLGGAALSSLGDVTKNVLAFGLGPTLQHTLPAIQQAIGTMFRGALSGLKNRAFDDMVQANKRIGIGLEAALQTRQLEMADIVERQARDGYFTRGLDVAVDKMSKLNLLNALTDIQKQMTGVLANDEFIRACIAESAGQASKRQMANLRRFGIDQATSQRIATEFTSNPANVIKDGIYVTDTKAWADIGAAETLERALSTATHSIVYNPSAGAKVVLPTEFFGKSTEAMLTQFLSFNFGSHIQHTVPMLQKMDGATFNYITAGIIMGAVVYEAKQATRLFEDRERPERNYKQILYDSIDQSGLLAMPYMMNQWMSGGTNHIWNPRGWLGDDDSPSLSSQNLNVGSLLGPTGTTAGNAVSVGLAMATDTVDKKTLHTARQLVPFQNLFYLRGLFDKAEQWTQDSMDIPDSAVFTITKRRN